MITDHKLLIDKDCPFCRVYGKGFEKIKLFDSKTVHYYQTVDEEIFEMIDAERGKSEVAFVNAKTGDVEYGMHALLKIMSHRNRFVKWLLSRRFIRFLAIQFYWFVSHNRHVMVGPRLENYPRQCRPVINKNYRWAYLLLTALITGLCVNQFAYLLSQQLELSHSPWREYIICFGQIAWQFTFLSLIRPKKRLEYLGNMSTISLFGALLLIPVFVANAIIPLPLTVLIGSFASIVGIMFFLHVRRSKRLGLPFAVSLSWVAFRTVVLALILIIELS